MSVLKSQFGNLGWYPNDPSQLYESIHTHLAEPISNAFIHSIICPHAGYAFCGSIIGHMMGLTQGHSIEHIIIIGPSHHYQLTDQISIPSASSYHTEIGESSVNHSFLQHFSDDAVKNDAIHNNEHSIWMTLPFIQTIHPSAQISPIVIGDLSMSHISSISTIISNHLTPHTLIIISSDFTHYGNAFNYTPFTDQIPKNIQAIDNKALSLIASKQGAEFWKLVSLQSNNNLWTVCDFNFIKLTWK